MIHALRASLVLTLILSILPVLSADAHPIEAQHFERTWSRTDRPVAELRTDRSWVWGPEAFSEAFMEPYDDAPGGERLVQYTDKSRMEDNSYRADPPWDVTNGLLGYELVSGEMQTGDGSVTSREPAQVHIAGDPHDETPTYATFNQVRNLEPLPVGTTITQTIHRDGSIGEAGHLADHNVTAEVHLDETNHTVASVFWEFMNASGEVFEAGEYHHDNLFENPFFAVGYPITEAYWTYVPVEEQWQDVLVQCFERRCLTFTPDNQPGWKVEAGNIGQHYYEWRYEAPDETPADDSNGVVPDPDDEPSPTATPQPAATPQPTATPEPTPTPAPVDDSAAECLNSFEREFLSLINEYRQDNGLNPLANSAALNIASYNHSVDMGERGYFSHNTPEGVTPFERMADVGYAYNTAKAENLAAGHQSAQEVFNAWRDSEGHNLNMLHPDMQVIGIGRAEVPGSEYGVYWTTKFGGHVDSAPSC